MNLPVISVVGKTASNVIPTQAFLSVLHIVNNQKSDGGKAWVGMTYLLIMQ